MKEGVTKKGGRRHKPPAGTAPREAPKGQVPVNRDCPSRDKMIVMLDRMYLAGDLLRRLMSDPALSHLRDVKHKVIEAHRRISDAGEIIAKETYSGNNTKEGIDIKNKALATISVIATPDIKMKRGDKLEKIYSMAHAALGECPHPHADILEEIKSAYNQFKETGLL